VEIALHGLPQSVHAHAIDEEAVDDHLANPVGVRGLGFDAFHRGPEGLATMEAGALFSDAEVDEENRAIGQVADAALVGSIAPGRRATVRTRISLGHAAAMHHADAGLNSIHPCVPREGK
jgi:hypothetical protein